MTDVVGLEALNRVDGGGGGERRASEAVEKRG